MTLDTLLVQIEQAQLVRRSSEPDRAYIFKHALVQDAAYASLLKQDRKRLHQLVGETLERRAFGADRVEEIAPVLAQHFDEAGDVDRALKYFTLAGDQAARTYAHAEAIDHYTHALAAAAHGAAMAAQWIHLYTARGRAYELSAQYDLALANYDELRQAGQQRGERALELAALMACLPIYATPTAKFDPPKVAALAGQALELAYELGDRAAEAKILWLRMLATVRSMRPREGIADGEAALALAQKLNLREQLAYTMHDLGSLYFGIGQFERGQTLVLQARELWRELDNKPMLADNLSAAVNGLIFLGELDQVIRLSDEAFQISQSIGNLWGQSYSLMQVGYAHEERGDYVRALATMQDCIRFAEQAGFVVPLVLTRAALGQAYLRLGAIEQAREMAQLARQVWAPQVAWARPNLFALRARLSIIDGDWAEARAAVQEAYDVLSEQGRFAGVFISFAAVVDAELALAQHDYARIIPLMDAMIRDFQQLGVRLYLSDALYLKSEALRRLGRLDEAAEALAQADANAQAIGSRRMRWQILAALGEIEMTRGNPARAESLRLEARSIVQYIADHTPPDLQSSFLQLPEVQRVMRDT